MFPLIYLYLSEKLQRKHSCPLNLLPGCLRNKTFHWSQKRFKEGTTQMS